MPTTDVILQLNMGFLDGPNERKMDENEVRSQYQALRCHMCNLLPSSEDVGIQDSVQRICFKSLEVGEWTSCDYGTWWSLTPQPPVTYNMQLTATIKHNAPLSFTSVAAIIEAIYGSPMRKTPTTSSTPITASSRIWTTASAAGNKACHAVSMR